MSPQMRRLFGFASFLPIIAIIALAIWMSANPHSYVNKLLEYDFSAAKHISTREWFVFGLTFGTTVFLQLGLGTVVGIYGSKRGMDVGAMIGWTMACVFVGSIALPIFYFAVLRKHTDQTSR
jgi:hypothetical protein